MRQVAAEAFKNEEWQAHLRRSLDAAIASVRTHEPRAASTQIAPTVRLLAKDAIDAWRTPAIPAGAGRNTAWEAELHASLDAGVAAVRELDPTAADSSVETLVRQVAEAALESWQIGD